MKTMNVSIPENQAQKIEKFMAKGHFASRSELFRTALRVFLSLESAQDNSLDVHKKQSIEKIRKELLKAGHNERFANSVAEGLRKSSVYSPKEDEA